jgi:hypothetical protein
MRNAILLDDGPVATAYPDSRIYRWQTTENVRAREFAYEDSSPGLTDPTMKRAIVLYQRPRPLTFLTRTYGRPFPAIPPQKTIIG